MSNREVLFKRWRSMNDSWLVNGKLVNDITPYKMAVDLLKLVDDYDSALLSAEAEIEQLKQEANA